MDSLEELAGSQAHSLTTQIAERRNPGPEKAAIAAETHRRILAAMDELDDEFRIVLVLRDIEEMDYAEIARVLKPGGRMLVSDIVVQELPAWVRENTTLYSGCVAGAINEEDYIAGLQAAGLTDVEVLDRIVYTSAQLKVFASSELKGDGGCCGGDSGGDAGCDPHGLSDEQIATISTELADKVWSAHFTAHKAD